MFSLDGSDDIIISDVKIIRYGGMGIIAQLCRNVEVSGLCVKPAINEPVTTTADILHIVNCSGKVSIHDCDFESSLDDACNVHGTYTAVYGFGGEATPKIHDSITITDNTFEGFGKLPYEIFGFKNVDIRNNKLIQRSTE